MSDERRFTVVNHLWNKFDPTLKIKRNPTSELAMLHKVNISVKMQRQCLTLKQRWSNGLFNIQVISMLFQRWYDIISMLLNSQAANMWRFLINKLYPDIWENTFCDTLIALQFDDTLFIVRLGPNMSLRHALIINY